MPSEASSLAYLWDWFSDLTDWRDSSFGVGPLSHTEMRCWSELMQLDPPVSPSEVEALRKIDRAVRHHHATKDELEPQVDGGTPIADAARLIAEQRSKQK